MPASASSIWSASKTRPFRAAGGRGRSPHPQRPSLAHPRQGPLSGRPSLLMPDERAPLELYDIEEAVQKLRHVLGGRSFEEIEKDFVLKAAAERFVEIISEASRRIRPEWKAEHPEVPWSKVASIGNVLRHEYRYVRLHVIFDLRGSDLA